MNKDSASLRLCVSAVPKLLLERVMNFAQGLFQAVSGDASVVEMADSAWADSFVVLLAEAADVVDLARVVEVVGDHHGDDPARLLHPEVRLPG